MSIQISIRYAGEAFSDMGASATMATEIVSASPLLVETICKHIQIKAEVPQPRICRVSQGSWEIVIEIASMLRNALADIGTRPEVSALANAAGIGAVVLGAIRICAGGFSTEKTARVGDDYKLQKGEHQLVVPKQAIELAKDPYFQAAIEAMIGFQLMRPKVEEVEVFIGNDFETISKEKSKNLIHRSKYKESTSESNTRKNTFNLTKNEEGLIQSYEERVLRFEGPSKTHRALIFTNSLRQAIPCRLSRLASRQIHMDLGKKLTKGGFYICLIEVKHLEYTVKSRARQIDAIQYVGTGMTVGDSSNDYLVEDAYMRWKPA